jgi:hypothetical protein
MSLMLGAAVMWLSIVAVLYFLVQPLTWAGNPSKPVEDIVALLEAASLAGVVHFACWMFLFPFTWNTHPAKAALFGISSTWFASSAIFLWIEGSGRQFIYRCPFTRRAAEVFADGQDIAFMPMVIPATAVVSGAIFAGVIWLSTRRADRVASE